MTKPKLILASKSSARIRILHNAGVDFLEKAAEVSETLLQKEIAHLKPPAQAAFLAKAKATSLCSRFAGSLIIGCDQILSCNGTTIHKATTRLEAELTLKALRGRTHELYSAVSVVKDHTEIFAATNTAVLTMRNFSDGFLDAHLDANLPDILHSVGCYQYEGQGIQLFETVKGDTYTIQGIPLLSLLEFLRQHSIIAS